MIRYMLVACTSLFAIVASSGRPVHAQVVDPLPGHPWLVAFETSHGTARLRLSGGDPHARALVHWAAPSGLVATEPAVLDAEGTWILDLAPDRARALDGVAVAVRTSAGGGLELSNRVTLQTVAMLAAGVQRGDLVLTEFMKDPTFVGDSDGEWIEYLNVSPTPRQIAGWMIHDGGSNAHVIQAQGPYFVVQPGDRVVLGNEGDPSINGGTFVDYVYSSFSLTNGADQIYLTARNGDLIDAVDYDDGVLWPDTPGASANLDPPAQDAVLNDNPANWCVSTKPMNLANSDAGSPGIPNESCP